MRELTQEHLKAIEDCLNVADPCDEPDADAFVTEGYTPTYIHALAVEGLALIRSKHAEWVAEEARLYDLASHGGDVDLDDCATEGRVFYPGDEVALNQSLDDYLTRTPPDPDDEDDRYTDTCDRQEEPVANWRLPPGDRLEKCRDAHREPGTAERIDNDGSLTL